MKIKRDKEETKFIGENFTGLIEYSDGAIRHKWMGIVYYKNRYFHNENGPATISIDGEKDYYLNGMYYHSIEEWKIDLEKLKK
jgi:hypothetical protein